MLFLLSSLFFDDDAPLPPSLCPALSQLVNPGLHFLKFPHGHSQYLMYLVLGMLNKTPSDREEPNFTADSLSSPSSQGYSEFTDCRTVCERGGERDGQVINLL